MHLQVVPAAPEQEPVLANLLELYAHDFSEFHAIQLGPDGRFGYSALPLYWREPDRHPFIVWLDGNLAGFVLVKRSSGICSEAIVWDMAEFFVLRGYRRRGIGTAIAHHVWRLFAGTWEIRVMEANRSALPFWQRAISSFTGREAVPVDAGKDGKLWQVFTFES